MATLEEVTPSQQRGSSHVIFIHGLGGHLYDTWKTRATPSSFWPLWLVEEISDLSVWTVGYNAPASAWRRSAMHLTDQSVNVLERILAEPALRSGNVILIGHSMGGLVIKQLLRTAEGRAHADEKNKSFLDRIRGVAYLATPHSGSRLAQWGDFFRILVRPSAATHSLVRNDPNLRDLNQWYRASQICQSIRHLILTETKRIRFLGMVVAPDSGDPGLPGRPIPIDEDHINIVKPADRQSDVYVHIKQFIEDTVTDRRELHVQPFHAASAARDHQELLDRLDTLSAGQATYPTEVVSAAVTEALSRLRNGRLFIEFPTSERAHIFAQRLQSGDLQGASPPLKAKALGWCARLLAIGDSTDDAAAMLAVAEGYGVTIETQIARAFLDASQGQIDGALGRLSNLDDGAARTAAYLIVSNSKGRQAALEWSEAAGLFFADFDPEGKFTYIGHLLLLRHWSKAHDHISQLTDSDFTSTPPLYYQAAISQLLQAIPDDFKESIAAQLPLDLAGFEFLPDDTSLEHQRIAHNLFIQCRDVANLLECPNAARSCDDYALWLELRSPTNQLEGMNRLRESMRDSNVSLHRVRFALAFGLPLDISKVQSAIEQENALSGDTSVDAAIAQFSLALNLGNPAEVAESIDRHKELLLRHLKSNAVLGIEIEMLARSGQVERAQAKFDLLSSDDIDDEERSRLATLIHIASASDVVEQARSTYKATGDIRDLILFGHALEDRQQWPELSQVSRELFERAGTVSNAERLANALYKNREFDALRQFLRDNSTLVDKSTPLRSLHCWALFHDGRYSEAARALQKWPCADTAPGARELRIDLAIFSGHWEELHDILGDDLGALDQRDSRQLMQAAQLARAIGSQNARELLEGAVARAQDNAEVLLQAYEVGVSSGLEDTPDVVAWISKAIALSGDNGPVRRVSLRQFVQDQPLWAKRAEQIWQQLRDAEIPLFFAAKQGHRCLFDFILRTALANMGELDLRRRGIVLAFSGGRPPLRIDANCVGLEATSLLTLAFLGLLETTINCFEEVIVPYATMAWLFQEKQELPFHQPSRVSHARHLVDLIATQRITMCAPSVVLEDSLIAEVGADLARLLAEAHDSFQKAGRPCFVVHPWPVFRPGSLMEEEAELGDLSDLLCSCFSVVRELHESGRINPDEFERAREYLSVQEREWPHGRRPPLGSTLYLDDLAVTHFSHLGLLRPICDGGFRLIVGESAVADARDLAEFASLGADLDHLLEGIRATLVRGTKAGKVRFSPSESRADPQDYELANHPTMAAIGLGTLATVTISDDRWLNRHAQMGAGSVVTDIGTTLDLLDYYLARDVVLRSEWLDYRTKLRRAGYAFIPLTSEELTLHLSSANTTDEGLVEHGALRAIRADFLRLQMTEFGRTPEGIRWILGFAEVVEEVLKEQWQDGVSGDVARARSNWLVEFLDMRAWLHAGPAGVDNAVVTTAQGARLASLMVGFPQQNVAHRDDYLAWLDEAVVSTYRETDPEIVAWIETRLKQLLVDYSDNPSGSEVASD